MAKSQHCRTPMHSRGCQCSYNERKDSEDRERYQTCVSWWQQEPNVPAVAVLWLWRQYRWTQQTQLKTRVSRSCERVLSVLRAGKSIPHLLAHSLSCKAGELAVSIRMKRLPEPPNLHELSDWETVGNILYEARLAKYLWKET